MDVYGRETKPLILVVLLSTLGVFGSFDALAKNGGSAGYSGKSTSTCTACHSAGAVVPTLTITGPASVVAGSNNTYTATIQGGPGITSGIDVASSAGTLAVLDSGTQLKALPATPMEIVHTAPRLMSAGAATFTFSWQAPATAGAATFFVASVSTDGSGTDKGDGVATATFSVTVTGSSGGGVVPTPVGGGAAVPVPVINGPTTGVAGTPVQFTSTGSTAPNAITQYAWNFGDNSSGAGTKVNHTFAAAGNFVVRLNITTSTGASASTTSNISISPTGAPPAVIPATGPTANAGGPYSASVGAIVQFDGSGSTDPSGTISTFQWNFGDAAIVTGPKPTHTFTAPSAYNVTLTVVNSAGLTATSQTVVNISPQGPSPTTLKADPGGPYASTAGAAVNFDASKSSVSTGSTISTYNWDFGDASVGTGISTSHTYAAAGNFTVVLTIIDSTGLTANAQTVATIATSTPAPNPTPVTGGESDGDGSNKSLPTGQSLYDANCASCHGARATGGTAKAIVGASAQAIATAIANVPEMQSLSSLTDVDIQEIGTYLTSLPSGTVSSDSVSAFNARSAKNDLISANNTAKTQPKTVSAGGGALDFISIFGLLVLRFRLQRKY